MRWHKLPTQRISMTRPGARTAPRAVLLATPAPPVAVPQVESGGGNNPLIPQEQDQADEPDKLVPDLSSSAKAPRMAPARPPEAVAQATALSWRRVCDLCFANDQWTAPPAAEEPAPAFEESGTLDSMAALVGLGVVLGSYWAAPPAEVD